MMPQWKLLHPAMTAEALGRLPFMLDLNNPAPAREQLDQGYAHGGGWDPFQGFTLRKDYCLIYSGDPPVKPIAMTVLRNELVVLYEHEWVAIIQKDRSFEVARMD